MLSGALPLRTTPLAHSSADARLTERVFCHPNRTDSQEIAQVAKSKSTSKKVATEASKILQDGRYSAKSKSVAGSALSQKKSKGK